MGCCLADVEGRRCRSIGSGQGGEEVRKRRRRKKRREFFIKELNERKENEWKGKGGWSNQRAGMDAFIIEIRIEEKGSIHTLSCAWSFVQPTEQTNQEMCPNEKRGGKEAKEKERRIKEGARKN